MDRINGIYKINGIILLILKILLINIQLPSQLEFQPIHLTVIRLMIITREMQQAVKY